jgi:L-alanine-DL-glutamate epimerase-like enolase superfamily enzyme
MTAARAGDGFEQILRSNVARGFRAIKLCIEGFGRRDNSMSGEEWDHREARLLAFAREIVGEDVQLMLDVYGSDPDWTAGYDWAFNTANVLAALDYLWFEEPLSPRAFDDYVRLTRSANIAIAGAEDFILLDDFRNLANLQAVDILQPDCTRAGGLTQMQAIRRLADRNGLHVIPHGWNSAVGLAADLQFQATVSSDKYCMVEVRNDRTITDLLQEKPFKLDDDGKIAVPTGAGLGVVLNDAFLEQGAD